MVAVQAVVRLPIDLWQWYSSLLTLRKTVFDESLILYRYVITGRLTSVTVIADEENHYIVKQVNATCAARFSMQMHLQTVPMKTFIFQGNHYIGINLSSIIKDVRQIQPIDIYLKMLDDFALEAIKTF